MSSYTFGHVRSAQAGNAFAFHQRIACSNHHIWPRTPDEIRKYAENGQLFGAAVTATSQFVALCYMAFDDHAKELELGGLVTDPELKGLGLGTFLARFALAYTLGFQRPWNYGQAVIAHVHEENDEPRRILERLGFEFSSTVVVPDNKAPRSMRKNEEGKVIGHKFMLQRSATDALIDWLETFGGKLGKTDAEALLDLGLITLPQLIESLKG